MIQTEKTPNPDSLKFLSDKTISAIGTEEFIKHKDKEIEIPFVKELLNFKGVELILLSEKFLSVKKTKEVSWDELKPMVISHLNDYFEKNSDPILKAVKKITKNMNCILTPHTAGVTEESNTRVSNFIVDTTNKFFQSLKD